MNELIETQLMEEALIEAKKAYDLGEVPIGAVITDMNFKVIGRGFNQVERLQLASAHAEMKAIEDASFNLKNWRLNNNKIFVTLEPCVMCSGALVLSRVSELYFGCSDSRLGAVSSVLNVCSEPKLPHQLRIKGGILEDKCREMLQSFFKEIRKGKATS